MTNKQFAETVDRVTADLQQIMTSEEIRHLRDKIAREAETIRALEAQIARTRDVIAERRAELARLREGLAQEKAKRP